ncbi:MAG: siphovirus Gp157 family protein [Clostridiaceae bacterium]|jgi:hypothetical protein|nr:siphovirus Gp157 family protein [Clostridiaceae bacterium]
MSNLKLYEIPVELDRLLAGMVNEDGEIDESVVAEIEALGLVESDRLESLALYLKNEEATAAAIRAEEIELAKRRKAHEGRADWAKAYLTNYMTGNGRASFESPRVRLSFRRSEAVVDDDPDAIPVEYWRVKTETVLDKTALKTALKAGIEVPGARLEVRQNLQVK